jgi:hypothetical protein
MLRKRSRMQTAKAMKTKSNIRRFKLDPMPPRAFAMGSDCYKNQERKLSEIVLGNQLKSSDLMNRQIPHRKRPVILLGFSQDPWKEKYNTPKKGSYQKNAEKPVKK